MTRRIFTLAMVGLLIVATFGAGAIRFAVPAAAQADAPDLGSDLPEAIDLVTLASGNTTSLPAAPVDLRLERISVVAGGNTELRTASGPELLYVETGTLLITDEIGIEGSHPEQAQLLVPMGASYDIRNDGGDDAVLLRIGLASSETSSQSDTNAESGGVETETLLQSTVTTLPEAPARLFLARATWQPGADLGEQTFTGPVGLYGEQGTLTVVGPSGIEGQLPEGKGVVFPGGSASNQRNAGADTAVTLVVGIIPADGGLIVATNSEEGPTKSPTDDQGLAPGVLYDSDSAAGFDEWSLSGGWRHFNGMLVNDGEEGTASAPYELAIPTYAIEAEIQVNPSGNGNDRFGFRIAKGSAHVVISPGFESAYLRFGDNTMGRQDVTDIGSDWRAYRLEVDGNRAVLWIDGLPVLDATDNRIFTVPGAPGLFTDNYLQVSVRSFRIVEITGISAEVTRDRVQTVASKTLSNSIFCLHSIARSATLPGPPQIRFVVTSPREAAILRGMTLPRKGN